MFWLRRLLLRISPAIPWNRLGWRNLITDSEPQNAHSEVAVMDLPRRSTLGSSLTNYDLLPVTRIKLMSCVVAHLAANGPRKSSGTLAVVGSI